MSTNLVEIAIFVFLSVLTANAQSVANYSYIGGIPLRTPDSCPAGSVVGQVTFEQNCCGADQTFVKVEGSVCCEDSSDCYSDVIAAPKCADPSWQLCGTNQGGFCCEQDWVCFTQTAAGTIGGGVGCSTPGATLSAGQSEVTTVYAANAGSDASTTAAASSSTTIPTTSDSTKPTSPSTTSFVTSIPSSQVTLATKTTSSSQVTSSTDSTVSSTRTKSISSSASGSNSTGSSEGSSSGSTTTKKSSSVAGGAIAGIIVGALVLLGLAFVGGVWFSRRKRNTESSDYLTWGKPKMQKVVSGMEDSSSIRRELEAHVLGKGSTSHISELPAHQRVVELDAGFR